MKFKNQLHYTSLYGHLIAESLIELLSELELSHNFTNPILCIVPSHKDTVRKRGYQVTELLAQQSCRFGLDSWVSYQPETLTKHRKTARQSHIAGRNDRLQNPKNSFTIKKNNSINGRDVVLLDDVYTTGATMNECTRILQQAGAKRVLQVAIAR